MGMAAKKYLLSVANKNYLELVEKRKKEIEKEREEREKLEQIKLEKLKNEEEKENK